VILKTEYSIQISSEDQFKTLKNELFHYQKKA